MNRQISFGQYRTIDLTILGVLMAVSQFVIFLATSFWYPEQLYVVSPVAAMVTLVMMRWGIYAAIHACLGGVIYTFLAGGTWQHFLVFGAGNLLSMLALIMLRVCTKEKVRMDGFLSLTFAFIVQLLMWLGRSGVAFALGFAPEACIGFITTDVLSGLFTLVVTWIVRRIEGLFEDQKHYLLRIQSERKVEGRE